MSSAPTPPPPPPPRPSELESGTHTSKPFTVEVRPIALRPPEAAAALGVREDWFNANVRPFVRSIRRGPKMRLYPVAELERWAQENAAPVFGEDA